ncbi:MAG: acyltransferase family protein [Phycisphaerales bacterium]
MDTHPTPSSSHPVPAGSTRPPPAAAAARLAWVDVAKGVGMILVVFGHVLGGLIASGTLPAAGNQHVYDWVYSFHMPAFMLLSALFLEASLAKRGIAVFATDRVKTLYYPALLWGLGSWCLGLVFQKYLNTQMNPWEPLRLLVDPLGSFWFLRTLLVLSLIYAVLRVARVPRPVMLVAAAAGAAACIGQGWTLDSRLLTIAWYGAWLVLGVMLSRHVLATGERAPVWALALAAVVGAAGVSLLLPPSTPGLISPSPLCAPFGVVLMLCSSMVLAKVPGVREALSLIGRRSLEVFLVSGIASVALRMLLTRVAHVSDGWVLLTACTLAGLVVPLALAEFCERAGIGYVFRFAPAPARPRVAAVRT